MKFVIICFLLCAIVVVLAYTYHTSTKTTQFYSPIPITGVIDKHSVILESTQSGAPSHER